MYELLSTFYLIRYVKWELLHKPVAYNFLFVFNFWW